jgi:CMP/dCMP kinase
MTKGFTVAIDGTASSGKSTTARLAARELGFLHLDTGAMYRAVTLKIIRLKLGLNDTEALQVMLESTSIDFALVQGTNHVMLDGEDVSAAIRSPEVDRMVSHVAVIPLVRQRLVAEQRRIAAGKNVVCEGRDITSVVFPHADLKLYVDANLAARAGRRQGELKGTGVAVAEKSVADNLTERDYIDSTRSHSPLTRVKDAILLDTTNLTVEEEVAIVVLLARMRMKKA